LTSRCASGASFKIGEEQVVAHHGSLARRIRLDAEQKNTDYPPYWH